MVVGLVVRDLTTCFKFGDDRLRGLASAEVQILPFPIAFVGSPHNTLTLPCERVISPTVNALRINLLQFFSIMFSVFLYFQAISSILKVS